MNNYWHHLLYNTAVVWQQFSVNICFCSLWFGVYGLVFCYPQQQTAEVAFNMKATCIYTTYTYAKSFLCNTRYLQQSSIITTKWHSNTTNNWHHTYHNTAVVWKESSMNIISAPCGLVCVVCCSVILNILNSPEGKAPLPSSEVCGLVFWHGMA